MKRLQAFAFCLATTLIFADASVGQLFASSGNQYNSSSQQHSIVGNLPSTIGYTEASNIQSGVQQSGCNHNGCGQSTLSSLEEGFFKKKGLSLLGKDGPFKPTDHRFDDFISPMINFVYFEDPRQVSEVRPIFVNQRIPRNIGTGGAVSAGGNAQLYALQFRARLTDRLSLIAVKDGFIVDNSEGALNGVLNDGWADITAGLKYSLIADPKAGSLLSAGFTYEVPIGSQSALQDVGDGEFHFFLTGGQRLLNGDAHLLSSIGYRVPVDSGAQSTSIHWSNHLDYRITKKLYVFTEIAWWHFTDDAGVGLPGIAGQDLFNLTANGIEGQNLVTQGVGVRLKPSPKTEIGVAYEFPLSNFDDIISSRLMVDMIYRF